MNGRPQSGEAAQYYFNYIDQVSGDAVIPVLEQQLETTMPFLEKISEEKSLHRYSPDKWSIREAWNHINDCERLFVYRGMWFARGFEAPLPSFDQHIAAAGAHADRTPWADHIEEFRGVRMATISFFRNLPADAWMRKGVASDNPFTVRAIAFITAGHLAHHRRVIEERYL